MSEKAENSEVVAAGPREVLADYLARCQASVALCLQRANEYEDPEQALVAVKLIRTSIDLVTALEGKPATTHRSVIERDPAS